MSEHQTNTSAAQTANAAEREGRLDLSIVVPIYNEEDNIQPLWDKISKTLHGLNRTFETIFIDDGSTDQSVERLKALADQDDRVKIILFRRNFGQTAAMSAGFDHSRGEIIIPMDGDLQNDPADIPRLLDKLDEGYDVVSGWRLKRRDQPIMRIIPSKLANRLISFISGVKLHDYGCSLKAYRRDVIKDVRLYGEMHRFIPVYASWHGAKVAELPVKHYPRKFGKSKYGIERTIKVLLDLIVIKFLGDYAQKPIYVFGSFGLLSLLCGFLSGLFALYLKIFKGTSFILTPLPLLTVLFTFVGVISILMGLLAEITIRTYYEAQSKPTYLVRERVNIDEKTIGSNR